jgi:hypothetical protein
MVWEIQLIERLLPDYHEAHKDYPTTRAGLKALEPFAETRKVHVAARDPWGNPYSYKAPGMVAEYEQASLEAHRKEGGTGEAADISSWADASLIGRWLEWTPRSALDITLKRADRPEPRQRFSLKQLIGLPFG